MKYDGKQIINMLETDAIREKVNAVRFPVGTKLVQTNGGPIGEIVRIAGDYKDIRIVRTAGVEREALIGQIDAYINLHKITIQYPA